MCSVLQVRKAERRTSTAKQVRCMVAFITTSTPTFTNHKGPSKHPLKVLLRHRPCSLSFGLVIGCLGVQAVDGGPDLCNLFIRGLEPDVSSMRLQTMFEVGARMRNCCSTCSHTQGPPKVRQVAGACICSAVSCPTPACVGSVAKMIDLGSIFHWRQP